MFPSLSPFPGRSRAGLEMGRASALLVLPVSPLTQVGTGASRAPDLVCRAEGGAWVQVLRLPTVALASAPLGVGGCPSNHQVGKMLPP